MSVLLVGEKDEYFHKIIHDHKHQELRVILISTKKNQLCFRVFIHEKF